MVARLHLLLACLCVAADAICDDDVNQSSGIYDLTTGDKHYFYWFFESRSAPSTDPVIVWMTGGPGCSSLVALFGENGPCSVDALGNETILNDFSWNTRANLLYVDQPAGTGFSYGWGKDHDEVGVAADMYDFLQQFYADHPTFLSNELFILGESYAGHYVPAVSHAVWANNKMLPNGAVKLNLAGVGIGNGLTDPATQYKYYADMAVSTNEHDPAVGFAVHALMKAAIPHCVAAIEVCNKFPTITSCLMASEVCELSQLIPYTLTGMNPYDMREKCEVPPLCYDFDNVATYLARDDIREKLGVKGRDWADCNKAVTIRFELFGDYMKSYQQLLPEMLEDGVRVLIYAGDQDYICNWMGNKAWTQTLPWAGQAKYNAAEVTSWTVDGLPAGELQHADGFGFLRVFSAGHMVPRDQPAVALAMIHAFTNTGNVSLL